MDDKPEPEQPEAAESLAAPPVGKERPSRGRLVAIFIILLLVAIPVGYLLSRPQAPQGPEEFAISFENKTSIELHIYLTVDGAQGDFYLATGQTHFFFPDGYYKDKQHSVVAWTEYHLPTGVTTQVGEGAFFIFHQDGTTEKGVY